MGAVWALGGRWNREATLGLPGNDVLDMVDTLLMLATVPALFLRHRWPHTIAVSSALAALLARMDTTVGLIALTTVVRRSRSVRDPVPWVTGGLVTAGTLVAVAHETAGAPTGTSVTGLFLFLGNDGVGTVPVGVILILTAIVVAVPVAVGLALRAHDGERTARHQAAQVAEAARQVEHEAQEQARTSTRLADTVDLQAERERVAREVHDGLGHRLSLLALHAGALEQGLTTGGGHAANQGGGSVGDAAVRDSARLVREEAQAAMTDLRSLLAVLREPVGTAEPAPRLEDLRDVVDRVLTTRQPLTSSIYLERASEADEVLSRAVYRIVQESLTNARKHVPGSAVRLRVEGGPASGVDISCTNPVPSDDPEPESVPGAAARPGVGARSGLSGMAKRAEICGGTFRAGPDGHGDFVVSCHLPWRSAATQEAPGTPR